MEYFGGHGYTKSVVNGCEVGLRSIRRATKGMLVKKQWCLATNDPWLTELLAKPCSGRKHHEHVPVLGQDVKASENYSHGFAEHVRQAMDYSMGGGKTMPCSMSGSKDHISM